MRLWLGMFLAFAWAADTKGENLRYEIRVADSGKVLHKGMRSYSFAKDIDVVDYGSSGGRAHWSKSLTLAAQYRLSVDVYAEKPLDGFGLVIEERGRGGTFSWNWFDRTSADTFTQLRGGARIRVRTTGMTSLQVASIEFLDDITLRYTDNMEKVKPGESSHVVVISKGSVLRIAP